MADENTTVYSVHEKGLWDKVMDIWPVLLVFGSIAIAIGVQMNEIGTLRRDVDVINAEGHGRDTSIGTIQQGLGRVEAKVDILLQREGVQ